MIGFVGIVNVTPDSFSDGGQYFSSTSALKRIQELFEAGAELVDVGAESTRPGATSLSPDKEWQRLAPVLEKACARYPGKISVDTYHPETAEKAFALGEVIVNDVTGMQDPAMHAVVVAHNARVIISHLPGKVVAEVHKTSMLDDEDTVRRDLVKIAELLEAKGLGRDRIILDPGIGFGKSPRLNEELLEFAKLVPDYPVMIGYSRKRFLGEHRMELEPNLVAGKKAIMAGARYLRVHDVAGHVQGLAGELSLLH